MKKVIYTNPTQVSENWKPLSRALTVSTFHFLSKIQLLSVYIITIFISPFIATNFTHAQNIQKDIPGIVYPSEIKHLDQNFQMRDVEQKVAEKSAQNPLKGNGMMFTQNKGQFIDNNQQPRPDILYKGQGGGSDVYLRKSGISYVYSNIREVIHEVNEQVEDLEKVGAITVDKEQEKKQELMQKAKTKIHRVDMEFENCNSDIETINEDEVEGYNNYYYAHCPQGITNVRQYNKIIYKNIYKNIDVVYCGNKATGIKYDIIVQPHTNPDQIKLRWKGAESICINNKGNLVLKTSVNEFFESIPRVYQIIKGQIVDIQAKYILSFNEEDNNSDIKTKDGFINFSLSTFNPDYPLIIDPASWITYCGNDAEQGCSVAADAAGNPCFTGETYKFAFPVSPGAFQISNAGGLLDTYAIKFTSAGVRVFGTYFGGSDQDFAADIKADKNNDFYFIGTTRSTNFPIMPLAGAYNQVVYGGGTAIPQGGGDAYLVKLSSAGLLMWSTYYGGANLEYGYAINIDAANNIIICGSTSSVNFPCLLAYKGVISGSEDGFIAKFNNVGVRQWATYYGGNLVDRSTDVTTDAANNIYVSGFTLSANFPVINPGGAFVQAAAGQSDATIIKLNPATGMPIWSTYYGGPSFESTWGSFVTIDNLDNVILGITTQSITNTTTAGAYQTTYGGVTDVALIKFNSANVLQWATYLGGNSQEIMYGLEVDINNNIYVYGEFEDVDAGNYPISTCAYQPVFGGDEDQFIAKYDPDGNQHCITYIGGGLHDDHDHFVGSDGMTISGSSLFITGSTTGNYPVTAGAFQTFTFGGAFMDKLCINICESKVPDLSYAPNTSIICINTPVTFTASIIKSCDPTVNKFQWTFTGATPNTSISPTPTVTFNTPGVYSGKLVVTTACQKDSITNTIFVSNCSITATANGANICPSSCANITAVGSNGNSPYTYSWTTGATTQTINVCPLVTTNYTAIVTDANGNSVAVATTVNVKTPIKMGLTSANINCSSYGSASVIIDGSLSYTYSWSNGSTSNAISNIAAGGYTVTVTDSNGCSKTSEVTIVNTSPTSAAFTFTPPCAGQQVCFTNTGTTGTYYWGIDIDQITTVTGETPNFCYTFLKAGTYSIAHQVTTNGCINIVRSFITVKNCTGPKVSATGSSICSGSCATVISSGADGISPYTYSWSNGLTTQNISPCPVSTTTYTVKITDSGGVTSTATAVVVVNPVVSVTAAATNISCNGGTNGSVLATVGSGTAPFTYNWSNGQTSATATGLTASNYTVTVTDIKGCTGTSTTTIISPSPLVGQFTKGTANCIGCGCKEWIMVNATGGTSPYTYLWPDGYIYRYKNKICPGTYPVNIKDKNGCNINVNFSVP